MQNTSEEVANSMWICKEEAMNRSGAKHINEDISHKSLRICQYIKISVMDVCYLPVSACWTAASIWSTGMSRKNAFNLACKAFKLNPVKQGSLELPPSKQLQDLGFTSPYTVCCKR